MAASCACRKRTDLFCFVHKRPVCADDCLAFSEAPKEGKRTQTQAPVSRTARPRSIPSRARASAAVDHSSCVVKPYSAWLRNADFEWPPQCARCCDQIHGSKMPTARLRCLCVYHKDCLMDLLRTSLAAGQPLMCSACNANIDYSSTVHPQDPRSLLRDVSLLLQEAARQAKVPLPHCVPETNGVAGAASAVSNTGTVSKRPGQAVAINMASSSGSTGSDNNTTSRLGASAQSRAGLSHSARPSGNSIASAPIPSAKHLASPPKPRRNTFNSNQPRRYSPVKIVLCTMASAGCMLLVGAAWVYWSHRSVVSA